MDVDRRRVEDLERQVTTLGEAVEHRTSIGIAIQSADGRDAPSSVSTPPVETAASSASISD